MKTRYIINANYKIPEDLLTAARENLSFYGKDGDPIDPIVLYNLNDVPECVVYNISTGGFLYIDVNNYKVTEYCPEGVSEVHSFLAARRSTPRFYYNGPMNIFYDDGANQVTHIITGKTYTKDEFTTIFTEAPKAYSATPVTYGTPITGGYLTDSTVSWSTGTYMCVPTAFGIFLEYYQRVFNYNGAKQYVGSGGTSQSAVCGRLIGNVDGIDYLTNYGGGLNFRLAVYGGTDPSKPDRHCTGLNTYTNQSFYTAGYTFQYSPSFDYNNIVARINVNKPAVLTVRVGVALPQITKDSHAVVVVGHRTNPNGDQVLVFNDGWGNNQRYVIRDNRYMSEYVYLQ